MMLLIYTFWYLFLMMDLIAVPIISYLFKQSTCVLCGWLYSETEVQSCDDSPSYLNTHGDVLYSVAFKNENLNQNVMNEFHISLWIVIYSFENKGPIDTCIWGF